MCCRAISRYHQYYGFGYDQVNDDYRVVNGSNSDVCEGKEPIVCVFLLPRGTWNTYHGPKNSHMKWKGSLLNGVLHWVRFDSSSKEHGKEVIPFSFSEEKFLEAMPLPYKFSGIFVSRDHLYVYSDRGRWYVRIMMMKEYGVHESWTEVFYMTLRSLRDIEFPYDVDFMTPMWIMENGDLLAWTIDAGAFFSVYKSKDKTFGYVFKVNGTFYHSEVTYRETLVSPVTCNLKTTSVSVCGDVHSCHEH